MVHHQWQLRGPEVVQHAIAHSVIQRHPAKPIKGIKRSL